MRVYERDYQSEDVAAILAALDAGEPTLAVEFTGAGKTNVMAEVARRRPGRSLFLVHRKELVEQIADRVRRITSDPHAVAVEMALDRSDEADFLYQRRFVAASVQTLSNPARLARFAPDAFGTLFVDEAHRATAPSYLTVIDHFWPHAGLVGVTATPQRGDNVPLRRLFTRVAANRPLTWGVDNGWLVPVRQKVVKIDGLNLSGLRTSDGDWTAEQIDRAFAEDGPLHAVARPLAEIVPHGQQALVFCGGVNSAEGLAQVLNGYRPGAARWVCGDRRRCPPEDRQQIVKDFKSGRLTFLVNVGCYTEGFDHPPTAFVVIARPTKKVGLYLQMLGRGTRTLPDTVDGLSGPAARKDAIAASGKPYCTVLDFVGSSGRFDVRQITAADVLGDAASKEVRQRARELLERRKGGGDVQEALERAAEQLEAMRELDRETAERERLRRALRAEVAYRVEDAGTIGVGDQRIPNQQEPATPKQRGMLKRLGVPWHKTEGISKRQASGWIGSLMAKKEGAAA